MFHSTQWFYKRTVKAQIRLRGCAVWSGPTLSVYTQRHDFAWHDLYISFPTDRSKAVLSVAVLLCFCVSGFICDVCFVIFVPLSPFGASERLCLVISGYLHSYSYMYSYFNKSNRHIWKKQNFTTCFLKWHYVACLCDEFVWGHKLANQIKRNFLTLKQLITTLADGILTSLFTWNAKSCFL